MIKTKRSLFGLNRRRVNELFDKREAEYTKELEEKLAEIDELKTKNLAAQEQIERYKKNENFMTDTLVEVMERAENAELKQKETNEKFLLMRERVNALNDAYTEQMNALKESTEARITEILSMIDSVQLAAPAEEKPMLPGEKKTEEESDEEYRFLQTLMQNEKAEIEENGESNVTENTEQSEEAAAAEEEKKENGFDLKEAVTPKERLDEICKELGLMLM